MTGRRLGVVVDGAELPEEEAIALWDRFSTWMEDHRGDLAGFAAHQGYASVHPGVDGDRPILRISKSAAQQPYAPVRGESEVPQNPSQHVHRAPPSRRRGKRK